MGLLASVLNFKMPKNSTKTCLIVGGGLSGLVAATYLHSQGVKATVLDKGRGIGGRLATRRLSHPQSGEGRVDYGVQYITARTEAFQEWIEQWLQLGIIVPWASVGREVSEKSQPKYRGVEGIRSITRYLSADLDIQTKTKVVSLQRTEENWTVFTEAGNVYSGDAVIITAPLPQSLQLLQNSHFNLSGTTGETLKQVTYRMCLAVLLIVSQPIPITQGGSCYVAGDTLDWITCNYQKGISPNCYTVTLYGNAQFSTEYSDPEKREVGAKQLIAAAKAYFGEASIIDSQVHFWRYSTPINPFPEPFVSIEDSLYLAGDGFSPRDESLSSVENAFLSGLEVAKFLISQ